MNTLKFLKQGVRHRSDIFQKYEYGYLISDILSDSCKQTKIKEIFQQILSTLY